MPAYRIYEIKSDGRIRGPATVIESASDKEAIDEARRQYLNGMDLELWEGDRLVERIPVNPHSDRVG
jgi:hypothetical protein